MEITLNLNDVFRDEDGNPEESAQDFIRRMVVAKLASSCQQELKRQIEDEVLTAVRAEIQQIVQARAGQIMDDLMNASFTPVDNFGRSSPPTTFRNELAKAVADQCTFKPKSFSNDENAFTQAVKRTIKEQLDAFKSEFSEKVDASFRKDALTFAVKKLQERLGLPK